MSVQVEMYLVRETPAARLYRRPSAAADDPDIWIPRSQIMNQMKFPPEPGKLPLCRVTLTDFIARQKGLD